MKKLLFIVPGVLVAALTALILFSPYRHHAGYGYPLVKSTAVIHAPQQQVFAYLGNSANAAEWSSFVDHIIPLNPDVAADGTPGSFRRCFRNANESGMTWDEEIVEVDAPNRRRLTIFNVRGVALATDYLLTEQQYEPMPDGGCRLTFTVFLDKRADWLDKLKLHYASYQLQTIFDKNLANIRMINEQLTYDR